MSDARAYPGSAPSEQRTQAIVHSSQPWRRIPVSVEWSPEWSNAVFSLEERDRRWKKVRDIMRREGVDLIVCLPNSHSHDRAAADPRYLTQLGENSDETTVAFPI